MEIAGEIARQAVRGTGRVPFGDAEVDPNARGRQLSVGFHWFQNEKTNGGGPGGFCWEKGGFGCGRWFSSVFLVSGCLSLSRQLGTLSVRPEDSVVLNASAFCLTAGKIRQCWKLGRRDLPKGNGRKNGSWNPGLELLFVGKYIMSSKIPRWKKFLLELMTRNLRGSFRLKRFVEPRSRDLHPFFLDLDPGVETTDFSWRVATWLAFLFEGLGAIRRTRFGC